MKDNEKIHLTIPNFKGVVRANLVGEYPTAKEIEVALFEEFFSEGIKILRRDFGGIQIDIEGNDVANRTEAALAKISEDYPRFTYQINEG